MSMTPPPMALMVLVLWIRSIFFQIANFQMPQDVMDVVLEGVLAMETKIMLGSFLEDGIISLHLLNERVLHFTYGRVEARNKPPKPFQLSHFAATSQKLHLSGRYTIHCIGIDVMSPPYSLTNVDLCSSIAPDDW